MVGSMVGNLVVQGIQRVPIDLRYAKGTLRPKVRKGYLLVKVFKRFILLQGIIKYLVVEDKQRIPSGPRYSKCN